MKPYTKDGIEHDNDNNNNQDGDGDGGDSDIIDKKDISTKDDKKKSESNKAQEHGKEKDTSDINNSINEEEFENKNEIEQFEKKLLSDWSCVDGVYKDVNWRTKNCLISGKIIPPRFRRIAGFKRIKDIINTTCQNDGIDFDEKKIEFFPTTIKAENIEQGMIGDCYLLSSLSVLTTKPEIFKNIFVTKRYNDQCYYIVQFFVDGKWVKIAVDDYLPINNKGSFAFAKSSQAFEIWPQILEKAFAKLYGSYEAIQGGFIHSTLVTLTGGSSELVSLFDAHIIQELRTGKIWNKLFTYHQSGYLLGAGSNAGKDSNVSEYGIVYGHAYAILDIRYINNIKLLKLRNPWGKQEWNGAFSRDSKDWTRSLKTRLNYFPKKGVSDGSFWMTFADFTQNFKNIYICRIFDPNLWNKKIFNDEWVGESAAGCTNNENCDKNPQYWLTIKKKTQCFISLTQEDPRMAHRHFYGIGIVIARKKGKRIKYLYLGEEVASSGDYKNHQEVFVEVTLDPEKQPYTVLVSTFRAYQESKFTLTFRTNNKVEIEKIPDNVECD
eukprot:Anaeramoba_flamelloidesa1061183_52.p1 GENE.a1061183_52~~a1061183_52.p1  ORF type:complete len:608 (-),score=147.56 a1061183_52:33-1682(-)